MEANIEKLGYEESNLTSSYRKDSSGNSHLQFHNNTTSFTGPKNFNKCREDPVKIPGVTTPTGGVIQQAFEDQKREVLLKKSHAKSIKLDLGNFILLDRQYTMDLLCNTKLVGNIYNYNKGCAFRVM